MIDPGEAEVAVIGSCLAERESLNMALAVLGPEHFRDQRAGMVFKRMAEEAGAGRPVDIVTVAERWAGDSELVKFLFDCTNRVPSALNVPYYADIVYRGWAERRLSESARLVAGTPDNEAFREALRDALVEIVKTQGRSMGMTQAATEYFNELDVRHDGNVKSYRTGLPGVDSILTTGGFRPGQFIVLGARPGKGKSSFLIQSALRFAKDGRKVLFFSAEMTVPELMDRMTAVESDIPLYTLGSKKWADRKERVVAVVSSFQRLPITFNVGGLFSMSRMVADIEAHSPDIVIVDFFQRFSVPEKANRPSFFSDIANGLKAVAMTKKLVVFAASQLGRGVEFREEKRPGLADLKETGGLEEAADIVMFLYFPKDTGHVKEGHIIIEKQRNGPTGDVPVKFVGDTTKFVEVSSEKEPDVF